MKLFSSKLFIALCFLLGSQVANAGLFGWATTVTASDGVSLHYKSASGPTYYICENERQDAINYFNSLGYSIISQPHCSPIVYRIPNFDELVIPEIRWPWPGPVCLSCPYLVDLNNIKVIFPDYADRVNKLVDVYNIREYNKALLDLQQQFKLEQFEAEMFKLEVEQQLQGAKR